MAGEGEQMPQLAVEEVMPHPQWLPVLLRTRFWDPCSRDHRGNRTEQCMFCLQCNLVFCPRCTHDEPGHRLLKVYHYVFRSTVLERDMQELNVDVSGIQPYVSNGEKTVHLRPLRRSRKFRPPSGAPRCRTCRCYLRNAPNLFCSLVCKEGEDVSPDDFSGSEAERRYRHIQPNMLPQVEANEQCQPAEPVHGVRGEQPARQPAQASFRSEHDQGVRAEQPAPQQAQASLRRRPRKQAAPQRAPFH